MDLDNKMFFDNASGFYNSMIDYEEAIKRKIELFSRLQIHDQYVADLGCGTGIDSIALKHCGNNVDAFDPSSKMIKTAEKISVENGLDINFFNSSIENISNLFNNKYAFICSFGNTIANINSKNLNQSFKKINDVLQRNGQAIIHILNYAQILLNKERIINITQNKDLHFVRFYDFADDCLIFNILKYSKSNSKEHELLSTEIYPHTYETILAILNTFSFKELNFYGSLNFEKFDVAKSKDLFISLIK